MPFELDGTIETRLDSYRLMRIRVLLFALYRDLADGQSEIELDVRDGSDAGAAIAELRAAHDRFAKLPARPVVAVNQEYAGLDAVLRDGDELARRRGMNVRTWLTDAPIDVATLLTDVGSSADGAVLLFLGTVRDHNEGRAVSGMRYDAYVAMAEQVLAEIAAEAAQQLGTERVAVVHRIGELAIGDVSVALAVSAPHRDQVFVAGRYLIEEIKRRLPVWKHEHYVEGESRWLAGIVPPGRA
jgi:molybdopterin synthase catalytic subunit/molybdopterin converting factor small subunit